ncbi:E3 ubiquitin-protein ligase RNF115 isoform X2 [Thrips palmi]|uniref:RING-type E3 ubiquitin transferase n=1 Tax=Thrips palmi TaxID=161013 RepID=A0A6P8YUL7_THRPL|nr:E3 ubiquitin-protein ligase RNF115 isoform X2 [Thrips palmi]
MAEAVVEDPNRFFCHKCSCEIGSVLPDYTCPRCCSGFIEALDGSSPAGDQADDSDDEFDVVQPWEILQDVFLMGMNGEPSLENRRRRRGRDGERRTRRPRHAFENLMHLFVMNLNGDMGTHGNLQVGRGGAFSPEFLVGNPGDYAWGRENFDAIVTQLLNQIESTGPPPLAKEKISEIPVVYISQEQVDTSLQCSVCWENFKLDEPVRQLVCTHVYHEGCIIPWLELHGTCPVCRKPLSSEAEQATTEDTGRRSETLRNLAAHFPAVSQSRADQLRHINQQFDNIRSRLGNMSGSSGQPSSMGQAMNEVAAALAGPAGSTSTDVSGTNSQAPHMDDLDVD